jgi:hypothetical protein
MAQKVVVVLRVEICKVRPFESAKVREGECAMEYDRTREWKTSYAQLPIFHLLSIPLARWGAMEDG